MDEIQFAPLGNHDKPLCVSIYRGINIPGFLRWCPAEASWNFVFLSGRHDGPCVAAAGSAVGAARLPRRFAPLRPSRPGGATRADAASLRAARGQEAEGVPRQAPWDAFICI